MTSQQLTLTQVRTQTKGVTQSAGKLFDVLPMQDNTIVQGTGAVATHSAAVPVGVIDCAAAEPWCEWTAAMV